MANSGPENPGAHVNWNTVWGQSLGSVPSTEETTFFWWKFLAEVGVGWEGVQAEHVVHFQRVLGRGSVNICLATEKVTTPTGPLLG